MSKPSPEHFLSDARGIYLPRDFARIIQRDKWQGIKPEDLQELEKGPDSEIYWEVWDDVCRDAFHVDSSGQRWNLYQDGDLWLIPEGMEWSDKEQWFVWPDEYECVHCGFRFSGCTPQNCPNTVKPETSEEQP